MSDLKRQTLYAGTIVHFKGCPLILANDTEVDTASDLRVWQDRIHDAQSRSKTNPLKDEE